MTVAVQAPPRELYTYQHRAVFDARAAVGRCGSAVIVMPTGSGKTFVGGDISRRGIALGSDVLWLVHRRELVRQAVDTLAEAVPDIEIGVQAAGWAPKPWARLQVASVQTLARRDTFRRPFRIIVVDECHHARAPTWEKVLARWPDAVRIGLTATPERLDGKGLGSHFAEMVLGPSIRELIADGFLCPIRTLTIPTGLAELKTNRSGESRSDTDIPATVVAEAADAYQRYCPGKRAIFFGIHRQHSRDVCAELRSRGIRAEHVDGDDHNARRDRVMAAFRTGGIDVVGNCNLISEGFDAPACEAVLLGRRTGSITVFLQAFGRMMRTDPANPAKVGLAVDLGGSCHELGLPDEPREWSLADGEIQTSEDKRRKRRTRACDVCRTVYAASVCPHCGAAPTLSEVDQVKTELVEAKEKGPPSAAESVKAARKQARTLAIRADTDGQAVQILAAFNKRHGYALNYGLAWVMQQRAAKRR